MEAKDQDGVVSKNEAESRYEIKVGDQLAGFSVYQEHENYTDLVHTEVLEGFANRGLAGSLTREALSDIVSAGRTVVPSCSYVSHFIQEHPEFQEAVKPGS